MATLEELKRKLQKEKNLLSSKREIAAIGSQRSEIQRQISSTQRQRRFGGALAFAKKVGSAAKKSHAFVEKHATKIEKRKSRNRTKRKSSNYNPLGSTQNWGF